jgi:MinD-like ATPase involved in chromosome partitioning or flagellar assembly
MAVMDQRSQSGRGLTGSAQRFPRPTVSEWARRLELLEQAPVFHTLPEGRLRLLARRLRPVNAEAGELLLPEGEVGDSMLIVSSGRCALTLKHEPEPEMRVATLLPGDFFGLSWLRDAAHPASLIALESTQLYALDKPSLLTALRSEPEALEELGRTAEQRELSIARLASVAARTLRTEQGMIVSVYSAKGVNLAAGLARVHPGEVLLVDLSVPYTTSPLMLNLVPQSSLARIAKGGRDFEEGLLGAILYHGSGVMVLPGVLAAEETDHLEPQVVARALDALRRTFRHVIVDLPIALGELTLNALDVSDRVLVLVTPEITALTGTTEFLAVLRDAIGLPDSHVTVALNNRAAKPAMSRAAVQRAIERNIDVEIRHDNERPDVAALHGALSIDDRQSQLRPAIDELVKIYQSTARDEAEAVAR